MRPMASAGDASREAVIFIICDRGGLLKVKIHRISTKELAERMKSAKPFLLVDARPFDQYDICHMPGAVSIPEEEVEIHAEKYDRKTDVIIYCGGILCKESTLTGIRFVKMGFHHVYDYGGGLVDWLLRGNPTEGFCYQKGS